MLFSSKNISYYLITLTVVLVASIVSNKFKQNFESKDDEYEMVKKYLLNDSPLYGYNRPKLWIHSKYEVNARKWKSFHSRNSTDLNQPYIHLTIKTIINHCGDDFNICLVDDESFSKLIPSWDIDLTSVAEPMRSHLRDLGMMQLLYYYGGMVVPNSFLCIKNLKSLYQEGTNGNRPFVSESINRSLNTMSEKQRMLFAPSLYFMGANKNDPVILELIDELKRVNGKPHFSSENDFTGYTSQWCLEKINAQQMNLIGGEMIGVKTQDRKTILLENLMEENFLNLNDKVVGIYIPADEILIRPKYQWFAVLPSQDILKSNMIISKYLMASIIDSADVYKKSTEIRSIVSI